MIKMLVTGGASGLGEAITKKLASDENNYVYFTYFSSYDKAVAIEKEFTNTKSIKLDISNCNDLEIFLDQLSTLDIQVLINNAWAEKIAEVHFHKVAPLVFKTSFELNVIPTLRITQKFIEIRRKRKLGRIITILTTVLINKPPIGYSNYAACKAYLQSMAKSWAVENAKLCIVSNTISPTFMVTGMTNDVDRRLIDNMINNSPTKSLLTATEVADSVFFLTTCSTHINGANIVINAASDLA